MGKADIEWIGALEIGRWKDEGVLKKVLKKVLKTPEIHLWPRGGHLFCEPWEEPFGSVGALRHPGDKVGRAALPLGSLLELS